MTRVEQLQQYLREAGGAKRGTVLAQTGIPAGTFDEIMANRRDLFGRDDKGYWYSREGMIGKWLNGEPIPCCTCGELNCTKC